MLRRLLAIVRLTTGAMLVYASAGCNLVAGPDALGQFSLMIDGGDAEAGADSTVPATDSSSGDSGPVADTEAHDSAVDSSGDACVPSTCAQLGTANDAGVGAACGTRNDGCGNAITCMQVCPGANLCLNGSCSCLPKTCPQLGATCGNHSDGCGDFINCGSCAAGAICVTDANGSSACGCQPTTCAAQGYSCGTAPDGCGAALACGVCEGGTVCGGAAADGGPGTPNVCGSSACTPKTACPQGMNCGTVSDGCGNVLSCGTCAAGQTCGGGTTPMPNVCGCTPQTCAQLGKTCGMASDGCTGTLQCGSCTAPATCVSGTCKCTPATCASLGVTCGSPSDGCGGTLGCGTCTAPTVCGGDYHCATTCVPATCASLGATCGSPPDGCGGTLSCGTCTGTQQACNSSYHCACAPDCSAMPCGGPNGCGGYCLLTCSGCCAGASCLPGTSPQACGTGGVACQPCSGGTSCTSQGCETCGGPGEPCCPQAPLCMSPLNCTLGHCCPAPPADAGGLGLGCPMAP